MSDQKLIRVLQGNKESPPPIWFMRQAGRYLPEYRALRQKAGSFLKLCYSPELAAEVTLQPITRFDFDAAILFADILLIPRALGWGLEFVEGEGPRLPSFKGGEDLSRLKTGFEAGLDELEPIYETVDRVRGGLGSEKALIGFAGAPWTVATYMITGGVARDPSEARALLYEDRASVEGLLDLLADATILYLSRQVDAGCDALQLFESWASGLPDAAYETLCIKPVRKIVSAMKQKYPDIPITGFPRGAGARLQSYADATGVDAVGLDTSVPLSWVRENFSKQQAVQGNLDPLALVAGGESLAVGISEIKEAFSDRPFIFNLGHGILQTTPPEHVGEAINLIRSA